MIHEITLIEGDGIGPEISDAVVKIIDASGLKINWDVQSAGLNSIESDGTPLPQRVIDSIRKNKVALKAPLTTPIGEGFRSVNVQLRKDLDLYANVRPSKSIVGVKTKFEDIDLVIVRENTEDLYAGIEEMVDKDTAHGIKLITRGASERITRYAFEYALKNNRKKVTAITKANICKLTDGLFLEAARTVAKDYEGRVEYDEYLVDALCMQLVLKPERFDVMVMPNLYGDIVSDLCAGLIGGLGVAQGGNFGDEIAVFEPVHGSAPRMVGENRANFMALLLSAIDMLRYIKEESYAEKIEEALFAVLKEGKVTTKDLGGSATATEFRDAVIEKLV